MRVDPHRVESIIAEIADAIVAPKFGKLDKADIRTKTGPTDLVTAVDEAAERALEAALKDIYPAAIFIGEETVARDPARAEALRGDGPFWIVDPLDGTRNFVRNIPEFGTIVALVEGGETRMGWIYATPEKKCAVAVKGEGAAWAGAPVQLKSSPNAPMRGLRSVSWLEEPARKRIEKALLHYNTKNGHCSAYSYLLLSRGEIDFKISSRIHPWDHLAGALLVSELGGRTAFLDESEDLTPHPPIDRALLATAPGRDWAALAAALEG